MAVVRNALASAPQSDFLVAIVGLRGRPGSGQVFAIQRTCIPGRQAHRERGWFFLRSPFVRRPYRVLALSDDSLETLGIRAKSHNGQRYYRSPPRVDMQRLGRHRTASLPTRTAY